MDLESSDDSLNTKNCKCRDCNCQCGCSKRTTNWIRSVKRKHDDVVHVEIGDECVALLSQAVRGHQKSIEDLYSELEEERNAASSAANETMSMILRLQTEKAELEMEARQFKRFAEERECHDGQEILALEELLYKSEQTVHSLSCEIQVYKHILMSHGLSTESELEGDYEYPPLENIISQMERNPTYSQIYGDFGTKSIIEEVGGYDEHVTTPRELGNQGDFEGPSVKKFHMRLHATSMLFLNAATLILTALLCAFLIRTWTKR